MKTAAIAGFVMSIIMYSITSTFGCPTGFFSYIAIPIFSPISFPIASPRLLALDICEL